MKNYVHYRTSICNTNYHIIWCTKYRRPVLTEKVASLLYDTLSKTAEKYHFHVETSRVGHADHVHCFVSLPPSLPLSKAVQMLKSVSARVLFAEFPEIRQSLWNHQLWSPSYFAETIGSTSEENILRYIERQSNL